VIGRPILGDEVLEIDGGNLPDGHVAVGVYDDLEEARRMLWVVLHLLQPLLSALPFIGIRTQSSLQYDGQIHLLPFALLSFCSESSPNAAKWLATHSH